MSNIPETFETHTILFQNGWSAEILSLRQATDAAEIQKAVKFEPSQAAIIVAGSSQPFPTPVKNRLIDLISRGVAQAAVDSQAILIDDGMNTGVSEIVGQGVADRGRKTRLLGIPSPGMGNDPDGSNLDKKLDSNHTHFILNEQERQGWQIESMCNVARMVSCHEDRILTILVGGEIDGPAMDMALATVRRKWVLVALEGSGGLADEIVQLKNQALTLERRTGKSWKLFKPWLPFDRLKQLQETNPRLYEIISDGKIRIIGKNFDALQLRSLIEGITCPPEEVLLRNAWKQFATYDQNSRRHRTQWHWLKKVPLILSVLSTLMVLMYSASGIPTKDLPEEITSDLWLGAYNTFMNWLHTIHDYPPLNLFFRFTIILLPITVSIIIGIETRWKPGSKYILLRGAAESVKRGIYSFRVLQGLKLNTNEIHLPHDEQTLHTHLEDVSKFLWESDVKESALVPYPGRIPPEMFGAAAGDDGYSPLKPERYLDIRVGDQLKFYTDRTNQYEKQIRGLRYWMIILGGVGTFLAAIGAQYWLPLTAAIVAAATAFLEYQQLEQILTKYNLTKASLENTKNKWLSLKQEERLDYIPKLVRDVEAILESENQGWVKYINQVQKGKDAENK